MIDWNNDGTVDPTEVVLTDMILSEQDEEELVEYEENFVHERKESWIVRIFRRRKGEQ